MSTVHRDAWGIPHLRAGSARELAFAQGCNAATDRGWQIEVERRRAEGSAAAFLGVEHAEWDRFVRQARLADTARRCYEALDADTRAWVAAYVDGVNEALPDAARRMPEFAAAGLIPGHWEPWAPLAIWLSTHILIAGFPTKLWREHVAKVLGEEAITLFATDGPGSAGSNGWLVSGEHTAGGGALIAGDPHRFLEDPGVYQQIHLVCPDFDVVGLAVPGVPGIAHFGHTGHVAWAITNAMADYQDLYREKLRRRAGCIEALGPDGWQSAQHHIETIDVAGAEPLRIAVIETERGPVIIGGFGPGSEAAHADDGRASDEEIDAISLRYPPRVSAQLGFEALPALLRAKTVADVDRAFDTWAEPVNVVQAADMRGGLLHRVAGRVPLRHRDNALRVVPAWKPEHVWLGWHRMPRQEMDGGIAVMANQRGIAAPFGVEFAPPHRANRIRQLLEASTPWSAGDMAAIHIDTYLASTGPLLDVLARIENLSPDATQLRARLLAWNRHMDAGSTEAAAYARLRAILVHHIARHPSLRGLAERTPYPELFQPWMALVPRVAYALETLLATPPPLPDFDADALVRAAIEEAAVIIAEKASTTWGELHRAAFWQALPTTPDEPWPGLGGDHDCVLCTSSIPGVTHHSPRGSVARYVWDVANRDGSLWIVPLGAHASPAHPHHHDQLSHWVSGRLISVATNFEDLVQEGNS